MKTTVTSDVRILKEQLGKQTSAQQNKEKLARERAKKLAALEKRRTSIAESIESCGAQRDELAAYDRLAPRVADEIRDATKKNLFRTPPLGPVGSYVKLGSDAAGNNKLATLLETEIGANQIKAYLCDSDQDRRVLWDIFARVYGQQKKPQIFTSKFLPKRHLVKRVEGQRTVLDYVDIIGSPAEATVIFNHLVDQKSIESVVVCRDQAEAKKIATYADSVPRNMSYVITEDCDRFFPPTKTTSYRSYYMETP